MGLSMTERKQLVNTLHNHVENTWANRPDYREFLDHLIERYGKEGLDGFGRAEREAFLELVGETL